MDASQCEALARLRKDVAALEDLRDALPLERALEASACLLLEHDLFWLHKPLAAALIGRCAREFESAAFYAQLIALLAGRVPQIGEVAARLLLTRADAERERPPRAAPGCCSTLELLALFTNLRVVCAQRAAQLFQLALAAGELRSLSPVLRSVDLCWQALQAHVGTQFADFCRTLRNVLQLPALRPADKTAVQSFLRNVRRNSASPRFRVAALVSRDLEFASPYAAALDAATRLTAADCEEVAPCAAADAALHAAQLRSFVELAPESANAGAGADTDASDALAQRQSLVEARKVLYLTLNSSLSSEETLHKLLAKPLPQQYKPVLVDIVTESCARANCFDKYFASLAVQLVRVDSAYADLWLAKFQRNYAQVDCMERRCIQNLADFFAFMLSAKTLSLSCFAAVRLSEEATSISGRIFVKYLLLKMRDLLGAEGLAQYLADPAHVATVEQSLFLTDSAQNNTFCYNFFIACGLEAAIPRSLVLLAEDPSGASDAAAQPSGESSADEASPRQHAQPSGESSADEASPRQYAQPSGESSADEASPRQHAQPSGANSAVEAFPPASPGCEPCAAQRSVLATQNATHRTANSSANARAESGSDAAAVAADA